MMQLLYFFSQECFQREFQGKAAGSRKTDADNEWRLLFTSSAHVYDIESEIKRSSVRCMHFSPYEWLNIYSIVCAQHNSAVSLGDKIKLVLWCGETQKMDTNSLNSVVSYKLDLIERDS